MEKESSDQGVDMDVTPENVSVQEIDLGPITN